MSPLPCSPPFDIIPCGDDFMLSMRHAVNFVARLKPKSKIRLLEAVWSSVGYIPSPSAFHRDSLRRFTLTPTTCNSRHQMPLRVAVQVMGREHSVVSSSRQSFEAANVSKVESLHRQDCDKNKQGYPNPHCNFRTVDQPHREHNGSRNTDHSQEGVLPGGNT